MPEKIMYIEKTGTHALKYQWICDACNNEPCYLGTDYSGDPPERCPWEDWPMVEWKRLK
jgi:hypothetical protein